MVLQRTICCAQTDSGSENFLPVMHTRDAATATVLYKRVFSLSTSCAFMATILSGTEHSDARTVVVPRRMHAAPRSRAGHVESSESWLQCVPLACQFLHRKRGPLRRGPTSDYGCNDGNPGGNMVPERWSIFMWHLALGQRMI